MYVNTLRGASEQTIYKHWETVTQGIQPAYEKHAIVYSNMYTVGTEMLVGILILNSKFFFKTQTLYYQLLVH